jgi:hypothetical protein
METASNEDIGPVDEEGGRKNRTVKWPAETDKLAEQMADDDGFTYKGRTHVNEWLEKLVKEERTRRLLSAQHLLTEGEQTLLASENATEQLRKLDQKLGKQSRKKK